MDNNKITVRMVIACYNANGGPDFYFCKITCSKKDYDEGNHYKHACNVARNESYEDAMVAFDENDGWEHLFKMFNWDLVETFEFKEDGDYS